MTDEKETPIDDVPRFPFKDLCPIYKIDVGSYRYNVIIGKEKIKPKTLISEEELEHILRKRGFKIERR